MTDLRHSPLHSRHEALGASFTPFGVWDMPLKYGNELDEHRAVRSTAGLFDLSHMGEIRVTGPQAAEFLDYVLISSLSPLPVGKAKYSMIINADGGIMDDLISYRLAENEFLVVPNAGNSDVVWEAFEERAQGFDVELANESLSTALIAVQGPNSVAILHELVAPEDAATITDMKYYSASPVVVGGFEALVARTGYTGEDGFELFVPNEVAEELWDKVAAAGHAHGLIPAGLAARDSLRLEAGMPLYGNELTLGITPVEAGMGMAFKKKEADFVGRDAVVDRVATSRIVGLRGEGRRAARAGAEVYRGDELLGQVTSGQPSPTLGHPVALALLSGGISVGDELEVDIRGKRHPYTVVETPFYQRPAR
ncbi:glycine cleavage system aminomethyltransferase GcvT [Corynebacterium testudinoris]|uniref:Aminomethyltransferase n=1 Tax=Corynebacterium testudinoris TaxID=136857 RepID=A0A0G3H7C7_9CORY|nr:glycine cleavage system aminomethyltransferase GcvT [Corynebacterium testudinoris]AKK09259.1 glycine cleavage system T protein [Corynebacterium testudinoris]MBX8995957.1 glycine cleavage system aminomethyltransferase GcvT [Corynebacterium testudinoris]